MEHTYGIEQGGNYTEQGRLITLLRDLTEPDRALLESRLVDGWDYTTIARRLGIPRADLVKRVQRIRTKLRRKAKALGAGETRIDLAASMPV
jgi:DNA-directed RNA polymerase specialized sigma24 family protein